MSAAVKDRQDKISEAREELLKSITEVDEQKERPTGEQIQYVKRVEDGLKVFVDEITELMADNPSSEVKELREKVDELEKKAIGEPKSTSRPGEPEGFRDERGKVKSYFQRHDRNYFQDLYDSAKGRDHKAVELTQEMIEAVQSPERLKAWATGDLEDVDLIVPDVQAALPFLAAQAKVVQLCRELRTSTTSVEFPVYTSGLTVEHVAEGGTKPDSTPTFDLEVARVFTIAGLSEVPNSLLEDYPAARAWIASELGRACGVQEDRDVLDGDGVGEPLGILQHSEVLGRDAVEVTSGAGINGRAIIEATFRAMQDVRQVGFTEPTDICLNPGVWTDIVLSYESNIGYLYGPPGAGDTAPKGEPQARLLGLPVTQDAYIPNTYGSTTNQSPIIVGNFNDAVVLRRSPFRIDVDTSLGFKINTTWFRGEERMGFIVVRPASFKVVTNVVASS